MIDDRYCQKKRFTSIISTDYPGSSQKSNAKQNNKVNGVCLFFFVNGILLMGSDCICCPVRKQNLRQNALHKLGRL